MDSLLEIRDLYVAVEDKTILQGINMTIRKGEVHVVMGPNGAGKSTLANAIMAHPKYTVTKGDILFEGESLLDLPADERARKGLFMSFQSPKAVPGITVEDFLRTAKGQKEGKTLSVLAFQKQLRAAMEELQMDPGYAQRYLNVGFSGGERKKMEILQMKILDPKFIMLDETDSGLDVDAVRIVSDGISDFLNAEKSCLIITHHSEILSSIHADVVHIVIDGRIVKEGGAELIHRIQEEGYEKIREEVEGAACGANASEGA